MKYFIFFLGVSLSMCSLFSSFEDHEDYVVTKAGKFPKSTLPMGRYSEKEAYKFWLRLIGEPYVRSNNLSSGGYSNIPSFLLEEASMDLGEELGYSQNNSDAYRRTAQNMYMLGYFLSGLGEYTQNKLSLSKKWLYRSAVEGYLPAQHMLGVLWLKDAAEQGVASANFYYWYWASDNNKKAGYEKYFDYAVSKKFPPALISQYEHVRTDDGPETRFVEMHSILLSAVEEGSGVACAKLGAHYQEGMGLAAFFQRLDLSGATVRLPGDEEGDAGSRVVETQKIRDGYDLTPILANPPQVSQLGIPKDLVKARAFLKKAYALGSVLGKTYLSQSFPEELSADDAGYTLPEPLETHVPKINETLIDYMGHYIPEIHKNPQAVGWSIAFDYGWKFRKKFDESSTREYCFRREYTGNPKIDFPHILENPFGQDSVFAQEEPEEVGEAFDPDAPGDPLEKLDGLKKAARAGEFGEEAQKVFSFLGGVQVQNVWLEPRPLDPEKRPLRKERKKEVVL